jgi:hypothetical protein
LINEFSSYIKVKMTICWHWHLDGLGFVHVKLLQHIIGVLGLTYERAILELLDLKSKKELQLSHHGHLEPIAQIYPCVATPMAFRLSQCSWQDG